MVRICLLLVYIFLTKYNQFTAKYGNRIDCRLLQYDEVVQQMRLAAIIFINPPGTHVTLYSICKTRSEGAQGNPAASDY